MVEEALAARADMPFMELVSRLPPERARFHLEEEKERLLARLAHVRNALGEETGDDGEEG